MNQKTIDRKCFKESAFGLIPSHWKIHPAGSFLDIQLGKMINEGARKGPDQFPYLANFNIRWGKIDLSDLRTMHFSDQDKERFSLRNGDILVCEGGEVGRSAIWNGSISTCYFQKALHRVRPKNNELNTWYVLAFFHWAFRRKKWMNSIGESSIAHFTKEQFEIFPVLLPPLKEQEKIGAIFEAWNTALCKLNLFVQAKKKLLHAITHLLLIGQMRFSEFGKPIKRAGQIPDGWAFSSIGEIAYESTRRNNGAFQRERVFAVTKADGMVPMRAETIGKDIKRYKVVERDFFAYNPMRLNIGSIARWKESDPILVSPDYVVFQADDMLVLPDYLDRLRHSQQWNTFITTAGSGSVRTRIYFSQLSGLKILIPSLEEQKKIANFLNALEGEIVFLEKQAEALQRQKEGLMQQLLTGKIRVRV